MSIRIETVLAATGGSLLNNPAVSRFEGIALTIKEVTRGSLFIATDPTEISEALAAGAYGIAADFKLPIADDEVAWIRWPDTSEALPRLLRPWLVENPRTVVLVERPTLLFIASIARPGACHILDASALEMSKMLLRSDPERPIICADHVFLDRIGVVPLPPSFAPSMVKVVAQTPFRTSLILEERYYPQLPLLPCLLDPFLEAIATLKSLSCPYDPAHVEYTDTAMPLYLDSWGRETAPEEATHLLLLVDRPHCGCMDHFQRIAWTRRTLLLPSQIKLECAIKSTTIHYDGERDLAEKTATFLKNPGYMMIVGMTKDRFLTLLTRYGLGRSPYRTQGLF